MDIIDAQLHDIGPQREWGDLDRQVKFGILTELMLGWMDAVGVQKALIFPTDEEWAKSAIIENPGRFAGVYRVKNPEADDVDNQVRDSKDYPSSLGLRLSFGRLPTDPEGKVGPAKVKAGTFDRFFAACEQNGVPLFCSAYGFVHLVGEIAAKYPGLQLIVDHMGIAQPPLNPRETPPWKALDGLLGIATHPNIAVKFCGAPALSDTRYPFPDIRKSVRQMLDAFGSERMMWASDIGRFEGRIGWENRYPEAHKAYPGKHTYAESLFFVLHSDLPERDKRNLLGDTVRRILRWG